MVQSGGRVQQRREVPSEQAAESSSDKRSSAELAALFSRHFGYVWHSLRRLGVPPRDLEDVTHDVFLHVHQKLAEFDSKRAVRPWLFGFAFRVAADYRRLARNRRELLIETDEPCDPSLDSAAQLERSQRARLAWSVLQSIELDRRAVFILHELDGFGMNEVAEALGVNVNTAYSRLRLAREDLSARVRRLRARGVEP